MGEKKTYERTMGTTPMTFFRSLGTENRLIGISPNFVIFPKKEAEARWVKYLD